MKDCKNELLDESEATKFTSRCYEFETVDRPTMAVVCITSSLELRFPCGFHSITNNINGFYNYQLQTRRSPQQGDHNCCLAEDKMDFQR